MRKLYGEVAEVIAKYLEKDIVQENLFEESLIDMGLESMAFIQVVVELEEKYNIEIPDEYLILTQLDTVSKIVELISSLIENTQGSRISGRD